MDNLITNKLLVEEINNIKMENVFMRGRDTMINGVKSVSDLITNNVESLNSDYVSVSPNFSP